jgi:hypothetical protein
MMARSLSVQSAAFIMPSGQTLESIHHQQADAEA